MAWTSGSSSKEASTDGSSGKIEFGEILAFEVKADCLSQVLGQLVERFSLGDNREIQALGDVLFFAFENTHLNNLLHNWTVAENKTAGEPKWSAGGLN